MRNKKMRPLWINYQSLIKKSSEKPLYPSVLMKFGIFGQETQKLFGSETLIEMTPFGNYEIYFEPTAPEGLRDSESAFIYSSRLA